MAVTIKDVAKLAGVSPSTVSRTCQNHPAISDKTKRKVRNAMTALGYEPSKALPPEANPAKIIGIILPAFATQEIYQNSFFIEALRGIAQICGEQQYTNSLVIGDSDDILLKNTTNLICNGHADAFIFLYSKNQDPIADYLHSLDMLYVLLGKVTSYPNETIYVDTDNLLAGREAVDYLLQCGHQHIAYLNGDSSYLFNQDRYAGYMQALIQHDVPIRQEYYLTPQDLAEEEQYHKIERLFTSSDAPSAILVSDDMQAMKLEKILHTAKIQIPSQVSIITFNNSFYTANANPPITSVDINPYQLGYEAARQVIQHLNHPDLIATKSIIPHRLIERESCTSLL